MKLRLALLAFAFLLTGALASATPPASVNASASLEVGEDVLLMPVDEPAECPAEELGFLEPASNERALGPCGTCSSQNCRGGQIGQRCGFSGGRWYTCQYPYSESCTDGKMKCYCWTGPLP